MVAMVNGIPVDYAEHGTGTSVLALHGGGVDHREIMGALEPPVRRAAGSRRVYPDLPGMGRTPAPETVDGADAVLDTLFVLVDDVIGQETFLVVGHSYGGDVARVIVRSEPSSHSQGTGRAISGPFRARRLRFHHGHPRALMAS